MKQINNYIFEHLHITKDTGKQEYHYHPKNEYELKKIINKLIKERGYDADLNDIDTSEITDMSDLFYNSSFNGDISDWNVSNVEDMGCMFKFSAYNGDISKWDVSNVRFMNNMFEGSCFNGDISKWDVSNVKYMEDIFCACALEKYNNLPKWYKD